jgi:hypothetical protein
MKLFEFLKKLFHFVVKVRTKIVEFFTGLPFWGEVERISLFVAGPVRGVAGTTLKMFPSLKLAEKYLEIESLRERSPVILAISIVFLIFHGLMTSPNGHIGTDTSVFPALTMISAFNPFLGGLCGVVFGAADLIQKLINPDIYGAMKWSSPNYPGAMLGYLISYSIVIWMGVVPGVMTRVVRNWAVSIVIKMWQKRNAANADGAIPPGQEAMVGGAAILGGALGGGITGFASVSVVAPVLELPAFYLRPEPDVSCYESEVSTLRATAPSSGAAGLVGGTFPPTNPTPPPTGGGKIQKDTEGSPGDGIDDQVRDEVGMSSEEFPWQVPGPDGKIRYFETEENAQKYCDYLIKAEDTRQAENDFKNASEQIAFLESLRQGLKDSGRDTTQQDENIARWKRIQSEARNKVNAFGGSTDYQARERSAWSFGEHDDLLRSQKEKRELLRDIHKTSQATRNLVDKGNISYIDGQTKNILDRLGEWSNNLTTGEGKQPTREELEKMQSILKSEMDAANARNEAKNSNWVKEGAQMTSREIFTGVNADGETSYKAIALRGVMGVATGGQSEYVMEVGDKMYIIHDEVQKGKTGLEAFTTAAKRVIIDDITGRVIEGGVGVVGKAGGAGYNTFVKGSGVDEALTSRVKNTKDFLNQDVGELMKGGSRSVGDNVAVRPKLETDVAGGAGEVKLSDTEIQRKAAFEQGRIEGAKKVDDLEQAIQNKKANPDSLKAQKELDEAIDAVQQDKHAMQDMNRRPQDASSQELRQEFNRELKTSYEQAHDTARQRIADEYGVPVEKVKVVKPTNSPGVGGQVEAADPRGFAKKQDPNFKTDPNDYVQKKPGEFEVDANGEKVSFDQDVTYRVEQDKVIDPRTGEVKSGYVDVPKDDAKRIYEQEFYKSRHNGELPTKTNPKTGEIEVDTKAVSDYNKKMDQATTDRLDAEAYGNGDKDLQTAVKGEYKGRDFDDVEGVGKTMEYKQNEWKNDAHAANVEAEKLRAESKNLRAEGDIEGANLAAKRAESFEARAEGLTEEGYRQTTKQYGNQLEARVDAVNQQAYKQQHGELPMKQNPKTGQAEVDMDKIREFVSENRKNPNVRVAEIPPKLTEAVDIMKKTGEPGFSPVEVDAKLRAIGYDSDKVVQQMSSNIEALQKFKGAGSGVMDPTSTEFNRNGFTKAIGSQLYDDIKDQ